MLTFNYENAALQIVFFVIFNPFFFSNFTPALPNTFKECKSDRRVSYN